MQGLGISEWTLILLYGLLIVLPFWKILKKAGYHSAWSLVVFVPVLNVIVLYVFAFAKWPNLKQPEN